MTPLVLPPEPAPWWMRPGLWLVGRLLGRIPLPARLLTHFPKAAVGAGALEALVAHPKDLDGRLLAITRLVASVTVACPFCVDLNASGWKEAGLRAEELEALLSGRVAETFSARERLVARYAAVLSSTPVAVPDDLADELRAAFSPRELVILASTAAQVNFWARFASGLGVPPEGFYANDACALPPPR